VNVGFVGLGKLGLPVALAVESKGHAVKGFDINPAVADILKRRVLPYKEVGAQELLDVSAIEIVSPTELVEWAHIIFIAVQTPHAPEYEGVTPLPQERADFNYEYLKSAVALFSSIAGDQQREITLVVISTCLPGTFDRDIDSLLNPYVSYFYNPFFIAMGTTISDFLNPEFVLMGASWWDGSQSPRTYATLLDEFYATIHSAPVFTTDIITAELIKVAYNTFIGQKVVFANAMMEICEKVGADVDDLADALSLATDRLISPRYMRGGMGDGGGCHPRDNIAMSWLARKLNLSHDIFDDIMYAREMQTLWLSQLIADAHREAPHLSVMLLGRAYKPETNLTVGSPARLLSDLLSKRGVPHSLYDPHCGDQPYDWSQSRLYFIATDHPEFRQMTFAKGSIVIDPWRGIGRRRKPQGGFVAPGTPYMVGVDGPEEFKPLKARGGAGLP
jgi:UDPglucose 6-dehydrogenase